jgi:hypothetical protein
MPNSKFYVAFDDDLTADFARSALTDLGQELFAYARQFYIPALEGEAMNEWIDRAAAGTLCRRTAPFIDLLRAVIGVVNATTDDLDALIKPNQTKPARPVLTVDPLVLPHPPRGNVNPYTIPFDPPDPEFFRPPPTAKKDSLLNPAPKGFVGSDKLPFDSDVD